MKYNRQAFCDATDESKLDLIKKEIDLATHNGTTKEDMLMLIEWLYSKVIEKKWVPFALEYDEEKQVEILQGKLPEENEEILVTDGETVWEDTFLRDGEECWLDSNIDLVDTAIAWMPRQVPKPYKPGNEQLPGQMSVRDIPGVVPEGGR